MSRNQQESIPDTGRMVQGSDGGRVAVITGIQAKVVSRGLDRIPARFYAVIRHSDVEWRTEHKRSSVKTDVVAWHLRIPVPSDTFATVFLEIYASFEIQPVLGDGEKLRQMSVTVEQLLNNSARGTTFVFSGDGDAVSSCSSISMTVRWKKHETGYSSQSKLPHTFNSTTESQSHNELETATNEGHKAMCRYRETKEYQDLDHATERFEHVVNICPINHPSRPAAQANLATAKFIRCQIDNIDGSFDVPLGLYRDALDSRPVGHPDRPFTLIQLATVHFARFERGQDQADITRAKALLREAMKLSSAKSHENQAAGSMLRRHRQVSTALNSASGFTDEDSWALSVKLLLHFQQSWDVDDLQRAILLLEASLQSTGVSDSQYPGGLTNLGAALFYRFRLLGDVNDLNQGILKLCGAVELTPVGHPARPNRLNTLATSFKDRFACLGEASDLENAISMYTDALNLTPDGHPDKPRYLCNLGNILKARFERLEQLNDLEQAILKLGEALDLIQDGHPDRFSYLVNLGSALFVRFCSLGRTGDLEEAILKLTHAVDLTPDDHPDKPNSLNNLGSIFFARFERFGELSNLEQALSTYKDAVGRTPIGHVSRASHLGNLGNAFLARFERLDHVDDLEQAISRFEEAITLTPDEHPNKAGYVNNLGNAFRARFGRFGGMNHLEQAISKYRDALSLCPDEHPDRRSYLNNLGLAVETRFDSLGNLDDLTQAISKLSDAIDVTPDDHPDKHIHLHNIGNAFLTRFERLGKLSDIQESVSRHKDAVDFTPENHPDKPSHLNDLGSALRVRFERLGEMNDLEEAILKHKGAVDLIPNDHVLYPHHLQHLGSAFLSRFRRLSDEKDLEKAISSLSNAAKQIPDDHPDKPDHLKTLGSAFIARFERVGELSDVDAAISRHRKAVDLSSNGHPEKPARLDLLGVAFCARFRRLGQLSDLDEAISAHKVAVDISPDDHPDKTIYLNNLARVLEIRFSRFGELSDLEQAALKLRSIIDLIPDDHPDKPAYLNNLGAVYSIRFDRLGELSDLKQAISKLTDAAGLTPDDHPLKSTILCNLCNSFLRNFNAVGEPSDLEWAVSTYTNLVDHTPNDHPRKPAYLNAFGRVLLARFRHSGRISDLDEAISVDKRAVEFTPDGHPSRPDYLNNLSGSLVARFDHTRELNDLEEAISRLRLAVNLNPDGHPHKPGHLNNLGEVLMRRFRRFAEASDLEDAMTLYMQAACTVGGPPTDRFHASQRWIICARALEHPSLLDACSSAIGLLPQLAWLGLSLTHRYRELVQGADVAREAAAAALDSGRPQTAVEWLEEGRSIVWGELFQLRSSYEELSSKHPDHAYRLRQLSVALEHASTSREKSLSLLSHIHKVPEHHEAPSLNLEQEADKHRLLAIERDQLLREIRGFPGFERFLLHKEYSQLRAAAHAGPVVILNAAESRCDALIVRADVDDVVHVPLSNFTLERSVGLQKSMKGLVREARAMSSDEREGQPMRRDYVTQWEAMLSTLWKCVVKPVLDSLGISTPGELSRIFWCPTGPFTFLPIHAAGMYGVKHAQPGSKVFDFVISSYVPTLSILLPSAVEDAIQSKDDLRILAVRQPATDGQSPLPGVDVELALIRNVIENAPSSQTIVMLESTVGTIEEVLEMMKEADWVHFACHGIQDTTRPSDSGLCLADERRLKLPDMVSLSRPRGGLAFLSACQTATGDESLSDEAIHVAAGMLFAGYGGVVGTMWSISDRLAPGVARDVYERLFRADDGMGKPDYRKAALALHEAVAHLRDGDDDDGDGLKKAVTRASFVEWLPFIHVGL